MRTIKFRGKTRGNGKWYYGSLVYSDEINAAIYFQIGRGLVKTMDWVYVNPETVGQFTGLCDCNGKEIYEGDIVDFDDKPYCVNGSKYQGAVVMHKGAWCVQHYEKCFDVHFYSPLFVDDFANRKTIILGNIYDNTELLKEDEA